MGETLHDLSLAIVRQPQVALGVTAWDNSQATVFPGRTINCNANSHRVAKNIIVGLTLKRDRTVAMISISGGASIFDLA